MKIECDDRIVNGKIVILYWDSVDCKQNMRDENIEEKKRRCSFLKTSHKGEMCK